MCYAKEGDGIVTARPHRARKTVMDSTGFAVTCSSPNGVVVMDKDARILKPQRTEYGKRIRKDYENGKVDCQWKDMRELVPSDEPYSNTITTVVKDNIVAEGNIEVAGILTDSKVVQDKQVYSEEGVSPTVVGAGGSGSKIKMECLNESANNLRIRYLTPRECMRLQAFPDDAIDRVQSVLSKSATYKVAGNSIAVCCLKAIFKGIYIDRTFRKDRQTSLDRFF